MGKVDIEFRSKCSQRTVGCIEKGICEAVIHRSEHLPQFGLINMNARLYDPVLGRFLSPDPYVQAPDFSQNFNRYSYALNNPLRYVDEDGEFFWAVVGIAAAVSAVVNVATHWKEIRAAGGWNGFWKGAGYFMAGAVAGGASAAAGFAAAAAMGGMAGINATGFFYGAYTGAISGATGGFISETSNSLLAGDSFGEAIGKGLSASANDAIFGGLMGGVAGGIKAIRLGRDFWSGRMSNQTLIQRAADRAEKGVIEKGHVGGSKKHTYASDLIEKYQALVDEKGLEINPSRTYNGRKYILDVWDSRNKIIYDFKFGYPNKTPDQLNLTRQMYIYRKAWEDASSIIIKPRL